MEQTKPDINQTNTTKWVAPKIEHLKPTIYGWVISWPENFHLAAETDLGCFVYINAKYGVTIMEGAQVGSHCAIYSHDTIGEQYHGEERKGAVIIGKNSCIGSHSIILPNCEVGPNLIIPAFSLVKRSILTQKDLDSFLSAQKTTTLVDLTEAKVKRYL